jgi:class 3 adenylate cyclase
VNKRPVDYNAQSNDTDDEVRFNRSIRCCVGFVDVVDSTRITSTIDGPEKVRKYYDIFLYTMAAIARNFGAKVIKNTGECLIFYFPYISSEKSLRDVIESCIIMIEAHDPINDKLREEFANS